MAWKVKLSGETLPQSPLTVDIKKQMGGQQASQDVASASARKAEEFGKRGASGKGKGFTLPSSARNQ